MKRISFICYNKGMRRTRYKHNFEFIAYVMYEKINSPCVDNTFDTRVCILY